MDSESFVDRVKETRSIFGDDLDIGDLNALYDQLGLRSENGKSRNTVRKELRRQIKECLCSSEETGFQKGGWRLPRQILFRNWIGGQSVPEAFSVAKILMETFENDDYLVKFEEAPERWRRAISLAKGVNELSNAYGLPDIEEPFPYRKEAEIAKAARRFDEKGRRVDVVNGRVRVNPDEEREVVEKLLRQIRQYAAFEVVQQAIDKLRSTYDERFDRFLFSRRPKKIEPVALQTPVNLVLQLAIKVLHVGPQGSGRKSYASIEDIFDLATDLVTVRGLQPFSVFEDMQLTKHNFFDFIQRTVLYDSWYTVRQCSRDFGTDLLAAAFDWVEEEHEDALGYTVEDVLNVKAWLDEEYGDSVGPICFDQSMLCSVVNESSAEAILGDLVSERRNEKLEDLTSPVDSHQRPWLKYGRKYVLVDARLASRGYFYAVRNALCEIGGPNHSRYVNGKIGESVERWMQNELSKITEASWGTYPPAGSPQGDIDCVLNFEDRIVLIELKKNELHEHARAGDRLSVLRNLRTTLIKSQTQLARAHTHAAENGELRLKQEDGTISEIELGSKEVFRASVTAFDVEGFHDIATNHKLLNVLPGMRFGVEDDNYTHHIEQVNQALDELADQVMELVDTEDVPEKRWWYRSSFLPLELLIRFAKESTDSTEFEESFFKGRSVTSGTRDPFVEQRNIEQIKDDA